jgi:hypothetical protein
MFIVIVFRFIGQLDCRRCLNNNPSVRLCKKYFYGNDESRVNTGEKCYLFFGGRPPFLPFSRDAAFLAAEVRLPRRDMALEIIFFSSFISVELIR